MSDYNDKNTARLIDDGGTIALSVIKMPDGMVSVVCDGSVEPINLSSIGDVARELGKHVEASALLERLGYIYDRGEWYDSVMP